EPGRPAFEFRPFPRIAQISPAYDAVIRDIDGAGVSDLFLAQNHDHREPETGLWRGGVGQVLLGRGDGTFQAMSPLQSGVLVRGDATNVASVDVDGDGRADLVVTQNDDRVRVFLDRGAGGE
ncbi:MAG: FG-GAP repeat domain-containing protein, partial [Planctomycetota bacterium]